MSWRAALFGKAYKQPLCWHEERLMIGLYMLGDIHVGMIEHVLGIMMTYLNLIYNIIECGF